MSQDDDKRYSGLRPFDSERGRKAASKPRVDKEPVVRRMFTITRRQKAWLDARKGNASALVRDLLDRHMREEEGDDG